MRGTDFIQATRDARDLAEEAKECFEAVFKAPDPRHPLRMAITKVKLLHTLTVDLEKELPKGE